MPVVGIRAIGVDVPRLCIIDCTVEFGIVCALTSARSQHNNPATPTLTTTAARTYFEVMHACPRARGRPFFTGHLTHGFYPHASGRRKLKRQICLPSPRRGTNRL